MPDVLSKKPALACGLSKLVALLTQAWNFISLDDAKALSVSMLSVPEPTTATLSLLALAGLAARRRRK